MCKEIVFLFLICLFSACGSQKDTANDYNQDQITLNQLAAEKFNRTAKIEANADKTYSIVSTRKKDLKMLFATIDYFVFDHAANAIIFEDSLENGSVSWKSAYELKATSRNSKSEDKGKYSYIYNCKSNKKTSIE